MSIIVPYSPFPGNKLRTLMPIVPVVFSYKKQKFPTFALVDSGATGGTISTVIADELKIKWDKIPAKRGLSTSGTFSFHPVSLEANVYGHRFSLAISIVEGMSPFKCILGEADIFQRAQISFRRYKLEFEIKFREFN